MYFSERSWNISLPLPVKTFYRFYMLVSLNDVPIISLWNTAHIAEVPQQRSAYNRLEKVEFHSKWINFMKIFVAINLFSHTLFLQGFWFVPHLHLLVHLATRALHRQPQPDVSGFEALTFAGTYIFKYEFLANPE